MHRLSVLGSLSLHGDREAESQSLLTQPKRLGVLLYLLLARPQGAHRRDTILALFWPEFDTPRARNALSQTLHHLRRALGPTAIQNLGSELLEVDRLQIGCDAVDFDRAMQQRRWADAVACYGGELLPGFHLPGTPDFERWLGGEREHLKQQTRLASTSLAAEREGLGDAPGAIEAWRRALELTPDDETVLRRLMLALVGQGDRAGAIRVYDGFAQRLKEEFGIEPGPETRMLAGSLSTQVPGNIATTRPTPSLPAVEILPNAVREPPQAAAPRQRPGWLAVAVLAAVLLLVLVPLAWMVRERHVPLDPHLVVVAPFRLADADSTLDYLQEGMVDLFASRLAGAVLVSADPRAVLTSWQQMLRGRELGAVSTDEARQLARRLGAAHLLMGSIVGPAERPTLSGRLLRVGDGSVQAAADVSGPIDSLPYLIDRLAGALLAGFSSEPRERLADLMSASLPALERYLVARDAYRHGAYAGATSALRSAVALDSNFALAWLHLADAGDWTGEPGVAESRRRAWALRERLPSPDRAYLEALVGPGFPEPATLQEQLAAWERVIAVTPDRVEGWYGLGDVLFHHGSFLDADSGFRGARAAFERAVALDSGYAAPLAHLVQIAILTDDRDAVRRLAGLYWKLDSGGDVAEYLRWRVALALDDTAGVRRVREQLGGFSSPALRRIITWSQLEGVGVGDGLRAIELLEARAATPEERDQVTDVRLAPLGNAGRLDAWTAGVLGTRIGLGLRGRAVVRLWAAYHYAADSRVADTMALAVKPGSPDASDIDQILVLSGLLGGAAVEPGQLARTIEGLKRSPSDDLAFRATFELLTTACCPSEASATVDSVAADLPSYLGVQSTALLYLALAYQRLGQPELALRTLRRRSLDHWFGLPRLAQVLWLEGKLASEVGDTAGATRAYRHYLALRADPDPVLREEVNGVRVALAALEGKSVALK